MNELRAALDQAADLITAMHLVVTTLQISSSPARLAGLNLIGLYLSAAHQAIRGAIAVAARL